MLQLLFKSRRKPAARADRRRGPREPIEAPAVIALKSLSIACTTVDLSSRGAQLRIPSDRMLPGTFDIRVPSRKIHRQVRLAWRNGDRLGVEFLG